MNNSWTCSVQDECLWTRDSASTVPAFECVRSGRQAGKQCVFVDGQQPGSWPIRQAAGGGRVWLISSPRREHRRGGEVEVRKHPLAGFSPYFYSNIQVSSPRVKDDIQNSLLGATWQLLLPSQAVDLFTLERRLVCWFILSQTLALATKKMLYDTKYSKVSHLSKTCKWKPTKNTIYLIDAAYVEALNYSENLKYVTEKLMVDGSALKQFPVYHHDAALQCFHLLHWAASKQP